MKNIQYYEPDIKTIRDTIKENSLKDKIELKDTFIEELMKQNDKLNSILTELEEWLKEQGNNGIDEWGNHYTVCLYALNELKEKYK